MQLIFLATVIFSLVLTCRATISGPYLFWGHTQLSKLQESALLEANEQDLSAVYRNVKAIVVFVRNNTLGRLEGSKYPKLQNLVKSGAWSYLPQRYLAADPFNYNANIEVVTLAGNSPDDDEELVTAYNDAVSSYGEGEVLGILANREEEAHFLVKREAQDNDEDGRAATTSATATAGAADETDKSFIYIADGNKAVLYVNAVPSLYLGSLNQTIKLVEHQKSITFDDQKSKGYSRFSIVFIHENEKCILRFNFTLNRGNWYMKAVEVEFKEIKTVLPALGNSYTIPSAPLGFSYRCSAQHLIFRDKENILNLTDYQVQPWLNGRNSFGANYDCVGFITAPILAGVLVSLFLCGILALGIMAMLDMHTPNRFENSRSKQLQLTVQD